MCHNFLSVHTTIAMLETWHWDVFSTHHTAPAGVPGTSKCLVNLEKKIIKVSDFGLITLSKCRSRSWEQDNSRQDLENLTVCYDKCLQLVWWLSGKIKDWGPNIKMCFTLYLLPLTSVHQTPPTPPKKGEGEKRGKLSFWLSFLYVNTLIDIVYTM